MKESWKNLWGRLLFLDRGILPSRRLLVGLFVFSIGMGLLFSFSGMSWVGVFIANGFFLLVSFSDLLLSPKKSEFTFRRYVPDEMERGISYKVEIALENQSTLAMYIRLKDDIPQNFRSTLPIHGWSNAGEASGFSYEVTAPVRGKYHFEKLYVRYRSTFGLWEKQWAVPLHDMVKVIPDLTETKQYLENAQRFLLYEGLKIRKQRGGESEFAQIRNYVIGDDPRKINWRQTAKLQEVMTNEYEPEHGKYITILIDCGRMMGAELKTGNRLDKALEAAVTTAAAALKNEDYVGVLAFAKDVKVYIPPAKGMDQLYKILQSIYALQVEPFETNYPLAINYLQTVQKKRSFIILFSDIHTFLHEESALFYFRRLRQRHLFLMIGIEDKTLEAEAKKAPGDVRKAMEKSIAQEQINIKKREKTKWEARGLPLAEASGTELATTAVSHYIRIINQGLL